MENPTYDKKRKISGKESIAKPIHRQPFELGALLLSEKLTAPSHVGVAAVKAESKPAKARQLKNIETIARPELLKMSENVMIDGTSLRQIYETHLVGENGLRRLLTEHYQGGDLKKALRREIVERQIDFERDPAVRDMASYQILADADIKTDGGKAALDKLLKRADIDMEDRKEEAAFYKARAHYEADQLQLHVQRRKTIDLVMAILIVLLAFSVLILLIRRS
ncbi:MAG TPA: hypothetical protein VLF79_03025 [Candidatus Saccharimonadales bacterium]|nr:hypothetical protein [Candidatus Saccharimonadales bacterium]